VFPSITIVLYVTNRAGSARFLHLAPSACAIATSQRVDLLSRLYLKSLTRASWNPRRWPRGWDTSFRGGPESCAVC
jgi:hypothetical protein